MFKNGKEILMNQWMNQADFLHANTDSGKLKVTLIYVWPLKS